MGDDGVGANVYPDLNRSGLYHPSFGMPTSAGGLPLNIMKSQPEPVDRSYPVSTIGIPFMPGSSVNLWDRGMIAWGVREQHRNFSLIMDTASITSLFMEETMDMLSKRIQQPVVKLSHKRQKLQNLNPKESDQSELYKNTQQRSLAGLFSDINAIRKGIDLVGALHHAADPSMQVGPLKNQFDHWEAGPRRLATVVLGHVEMPNMWASSSQIRPGQPLFVIIKKVPISRVVNYRSPSGQLYTDYNSTIEPERDLVPVLIWYTNNDFSMPAAARNLDELNDNLYLQPDLNSTTYKEFDPKIKNRFYLREGVVIKVGRSVHKVDPINNRNITETGQVKWESLDEINQKKKIEIFFMSRQKYI
jgi:hypothetical protein